MGKLPAFQFYPADWSADTAPLTPSAKAAWIDILCELHWSPMRGQQTLTWPEWARVLRLSFEQAEAAIKELMRLKVCDYLISENGNAEVTLISRRMVRDEKEREFNRLRQAKFKAKQVGNESVTAKSHRSSSSSSSSSSESEVIKKEKREGIVKGNGHPKVSRRKPMVTFPEGFTPSPDHLELAKLLGVNPHFEFQKFKDGALTHNRVYADWSAAFRNWLRQAREFAKR